MTRTNLHRCKSAAVLLMLSTVLVAGSAYAVSILQFDRWMQRVEKKMLTVQRHIERKNAAGAAAEAKEIEELYRLMLAYFESKQDVEKGLKMFKEGLDAANAMAAHASAGKFDEAQSQAKLLARDCKPCHTEYKPLD